MVGGAVRVAVCEICMARGPSRSRLALAPGLRGRGSRHRSLPLSVVFTAKMLREKRVGPAVTPGRTGLASPQVPVLPWSFVEL